MIIIGIIGYGIVGSAMEHAFKGNAKFLISDPKLGEESVSVKNVVQSSDVIFVCVPTPMKGVNGGSIDTKLLDGVMKELNDNLDVDNYNPVICIKSTVIPSKLLEYSQSYPDMKLTMSPEYLTEASYLEDVINMKSLVVGGKPEDTKFIVDLFDQYSNCKKPYPVGEVDLVASGVLKYMENCYLAMKVTFMNQFYDILQASGSNDEWNHVAEVFHLDTRMGTSHYQVPGPDGDRGWGGKCVTPDMKVRVLTEADPNPIVIDIEELYNNFIQFRNCWDSGVFYIESCDSECEYKHNKHIKEMTRTEYKGEIIEIETEHGVFKCTPEHIIPVLRDGKIVFVTANEIQSTDELPESESINLDDYFYGINK